MARVNSIIVEFETARPATDAYVKEHALDQKYENPRAEMEGDIAFADLTADEDKVFFNLCEFRHANDDEFFRTVEYLLRVNSRFAGFVIGDILTRHLKRRKTFRRQT